MSAVKLKAGAATDVGRVRQINQDSFLVLADRDLYVVADGMGGHLGGEVASQLAVEALSSAYDARTGDALADAIAEANGRIHEQGAADPNLHGMGTTVVAAALLEDDGSYEGGQLLVANVGDSRAYLFRDGELTQVTEDHSMVADLLREGRITEAEAEVHPQRNIVTRVLGVYDQVDIDFWPVDPIRGDRVLLCSDGLVNEVSADQIAAVLRRLSDPQDAASELVRRANEGGGRDNITVVVVDVVADGGVAEAASEALADDPVRTGAAALDAAEADATGADASRWARAKARREERVPMRSRLTWRTLLFALGVIAVVGGAFATIQWYGTSTYYVGFDGDEVAIYRGRPGGLLWIDPELERTTGIDRELVPPRYLPAVEEGKEQSSLGEALRYVANIERDIPPPTTTTTSTTSTTLPGTPTTVPVTPPPTAAN